MHVKIPKEKLYLNEHIKVTLTVLVTYWGVLSGNSLAFQFSSVKKVTIAIIIFIPCILPYFSLDTSLPHELPIVVCLKGHCHDKANVRS